MIRFLFLVSLLMFGACLEERTHRLKSGFDISGLMDSQITSLVKSHALIVKTVRINDQVNESRFIPDREAWDRELNMFDKLDLINKPAYANVYEVTEGKQATGGVRWRRYHTREPVPIPEFKVYYEDTLDTIQKIEATVRRTSLLYFSHRTLVMEFETFESTFLLKRYAIEGVQKMIFRDSVRFAISSKVM